MPRHPGGIVPGKFGRHWTFASWLKRSPRSRAWAARSDGSADFFNQRWLDYTGLSAEQAWDWG